MWFVASTALKRYRLQWFSRFFSLLALTSLWTMFASLQRRRLCVQSPPCVVSKTFSRSFESFKHTQKHKHTHTHTRIVRICHVLNDSTMAAGLCPLCLVFTAFYRHRVCVRRVVCMFFYGIIWMLNCQEVDANRRYLSRSFDLAQWWRFIPFLAFLHWNNCYISGREKSPSDAPTSISNYAFVMMRLCQ